MSHNVIGCPGAGEDFDKRCIVPVRDLFHLRSGFGFGSFLGVEVFEHLRDELIGLCENWNVDGCQAPDDPCSSRWCERYREKHG